MSPRLFLNAASWLLVGVIALFATGCGAGYKLNGITVSLVNFVPATATLLESSGTMTLRYTNENTIPIGLSGTVHKVYFNGTYVGKAVSQQPVPLGPLSNVTQDVTVNFENLALVKQLVSIRDKQNASYRIESVLYITSGEEKLNIKTENSGSVDLRALAPMMQ